MSYNPSPFVGMWVTCCIDYCTINNRHVNPMGVHHRQLTRIRESAQGLRKRSPASQISPFRFHDRQNQGNLRGVRTNEHSVIVIDQKRPKGLPQFVPEPSNYRRFVCSVRHGGSTVVSGIFQLSGIMHAITHFVMVAMCGPL